MAQFFYLQQRAFGGKITGQTFGTATTGPAINLLRIEENLSWLDCAERYDRAHTFFCMAPPRIGRPPDMAWTSRLRSTNVWPTSCVGARLG